MFRVVQENRSPFADGSGHPAIDHATENGAWDLPSLVLRSGALIPAPHAQPRPADRRLDGAFAQWAARVWPLEEERRAPAPPCNLEPLALGC